MPRRTLLCATAVTLALVGLTIPAYAGSSSDLSRHHHDSRVDWSQGFRSYDSHGRHNRHDSEDDGNEDDSDNSSSDSSGDDSGDSGSTDTGAGVTVPEVGVQASLGDTGTGVVLTGSEQRVTFRITGFGKKDNTPAGSTTISQGVIHAEAGGSGSFADPLTAASPGSAGSTESPKGMRFYVPHIARYVIIEDSGASKFSQPHLDIWSGTTDNVEDCEGKITGTFQVIRNPKAGYPVKVGPIATGSGCNI